jgi:hypothetical protein
MIHIKRIIATLILILAGLSFCFGQTAKPKEYLGVAGPVTIGNIAYLFAWSSHPSDAYYKQEYLAKGDQLPGYKKMVMVEVLTGNPSLKQIVAEKINELKEMKASNPLINYETFEKNGEIMLDFLLSENTADGKSIAILERNVYRYKSVVEKNGKKCLLLFAVSERAYGNNDAMKYLTGLKAKRSELVNQVAGFKMPVITISK